jgi:hypothetical protein
MNIRCQAWDGLEIIYQQRGENHLTTNEPNWRDHAALSWKPHFLTVQTTKLN